jgi:hypothetical protein
VTASDMVAGQKVIEMGVPPAEAMETLGTHTVALTGRECFLRTKPAAGRLKDLADIEVLRDIRE